MWLKVQSGDLVNIDRVSIVNIVQYDYRRPPMACVEATIQITSSEDMATIATLFESSSVASCHQFVNWLYDQMATGARVADVQDPAQVDAASYRGQM